MKLKEIRVAKGRQQKELAKAIGVDEPMISRFEHYKCLPTPPTMELLLKELNCSIKDIYKPNEIYIKPKNNAESKAKEEDIYHLTVNLPGEAREIFKNALKKCGYKDITYWVYRCYERLKKQYEIIIKNEKDSKTRREAEL